VGEWKDLMCQRWGSRVVRVVRVKPASLLTRKRHLPVSVETVVAMNRWTWREGVHFEHPRKSLRAFASPSRTTSYTIVSVAIRCAVVVRNRAGRVTSSTRPIVISVFSSRVLFQSSGVRQTCAERPCGSSVPRVTRGSGHAL